MSAVSTTPSSSELDAMMEGAARNFAVLAAPMRLRILSQLCQGEKNVSELLAVIDTTQPNISQHLATLYQAGFVSKRRQGNQIHYAIADDRIIRICRLMCGQE